MSIYNTEKSSIIYCLWSILILYYRIMNDEELFKTIAHNIKIERVIKNLTQEQLAEMIDVHEKYIGVIEAGRQNMTLKTLNKIANAFDINITRLMEKHL